MQLLPGRTVVHPHHGPATVVARRRRTVAGRQVDYVDLQLSTARMLVSVPADRADEIGIRELADADALTRLAEVLAGPSEPAERQWSRRIKAEREEVSHGDPARTSAVLRDLIRRGEETPLGTAEKDLLRQAAGPLLAEVALSVGCDEETAYEVTRALALEGTTDVLRDLPAPSPVRPEAPAA